MAGTGSALVAALRCGRHSYGIELNSEYVEIARQVIDAERAALSPELQAVTAEILTGNARDTAAVLGALGAQPIAYVLTSPPYWDMLHARGAQTQQQRRQSPGLDVQYSDDPDDLGNVHDYAEFLERLVAIYAGLAPLLKPGAYLTIIVKNVKKGGKLYPLAWDLAASLSQVYTLKDEKIWCQDDIRLAPYGLGNAWVSNTFHHYCLQFRIDN